MGSKVFADKFREIRKSLDDLKGAMTVDDLKEMVDKKIEWILNILIIWFDDEKYPDGMGDLRKN